MASLLEGSGGEYCSGLRRCVRMNGVASQKTYLVRRAEGQERMYELHELTWLWRTGEMAHDAMFRDEAGQWRPVCELVEPVLLSQSVAAGPAAKSNSSRWHSPALWW